MGGNRKSCWGPGIRQGSRMPLDFWPLPNLHKSISYCLPYNLCCTTLVNRCRLSIALTPVKVITSIPPHPALGYLFLIFQGSGTYFLFQEAFLDSPAFSIPWVIHFSSVLLGFAELGLCSFFF